MRSLEWEKQINEKFLKWPRLVSNPMEIDKKIHAEEKNQRNTNKSNLRVVKALSFQYLLCALLQFCIQCN